MPNPGLDRLRQAISPHGLELRGGFHPIPRDGVPDLPGGRSSATVLLVGNLGGAMWPAFSAAPEFADGAPHALDRWTRRILDAAARGLGAGALYPFGGPPYLPFQRWAGTAEGLQASPLGVLIHPDYGLWHAYRGALSFAQRLDLPAREPRPRPCDSCAERPCLSACPVGAFQAAGYDVASCRQHVGGPAGGRCRTGGCLARLACPVGQAHAYPTAQMAFHMAAFLAAGWPSEVRSQ
jgi:hypothetical protein